MHGNTITLANGLFEKEITTKRRASRAPHCLFIKQPHFTQESHDIQPDVTICSYNICPQRGRIMPYCAIPSRSTKTVVGRPAGIFPIAALRAATLSTD